MKVLIVEGRVGLAQLWATCVSRFGAEVEIARTQPDAISYLQNVCPEIVILSLGLVEGSAFAVADYASYRHPTTKIIPVTSSTFFSDGSVFQHVPNTCTTLAESTSPEDLAAIVEHYGMTG